MGFARATSLNVVFAALPCLSSCDEGQTPASTAAANTDGEGAGAAGSGGGAPAANPTPATGSSSLPGPAGDAGSGPTPPGPSTASPGGGGGSSPVAVPGGAGGEAAPGGMGGTSPSAGAGAAPTSGASPGAAGALDAGASAAAGSAGRDGGAGAPNDCEGGKVVHFVYFVEADQPYSESQRDDVERQALAFQEYWFTQLGVTFYLNRPIVDVIDADHDSQWYVDTPDGIHDDPRWYRLGNIKTEVYAKLGIRDFDPNHRVINYPITRHDGRVGGNFGGSWMDGDDLDCIADGGPTYPYDDGNAAHCLGHPAHEFGHVLGLDHEGPNDDCMQYGFYLSGNGEMCSFSEANVLAILADPDNEGWLEALPGDTCTGS